MIAKGLTFSALALAIMAGLAAWGWIATPPEAEVAVQFSASGEVNRTGGKAEAFLVIPALAAFIAAVFAIAPKIDPRGRNLAASGPAVLTLWIGAMAMLALAQAAIVLSAVGVLGPSGAPAPQLVLSGVALFIALIGNVLGKARPNWFVGVRTPWTLSSDRSWDITHRWAGRGLVVSGALGVICLAVAPVELALGVFLSTLLGTALGAILLSYLVWRRDPDRETYSEPG